MSRAPSSRTKAPIVSSLKWESRRFDAINVASVLFAKKGFYGTTTKDIADSIGILPGSLYYYFESKEHALLEVCRHVGSAFSKRLLVIASQDNPFKEKLYLGIRAHILNSNRNVSYLFGSNKNDLPDNISTEIRKISKEYIDVWSQIFESAVDNGEIRRDIDIESAVVSLLCMCNGWPDWHERRSRAGLEEMAEKLAKHYVYGLTKDLVVEPPLVSLRPRVAVRR